MAIAYYDNYVDFYKDMVTLQAIEGKQLIKVLKDGVSYNGKQPLVSIEMLENPLTQEVYIYSA